MALKTLVSTSRAVAVRLGDRKNSIPASIQTTFELQTPSNKSTHPCRMAATIPYSYIQCPCSSDGPLKRHNPAEDDEADGEDAPDEARPFDPRAPRANFSLYPMEYLLYCADCYEIRCQRCVLDEIVYWFCPNCLFEVPSSTVKSEGNRCLCRHTPRTSVRS